MNLAEVRKQFIKTSGRYDLIASGDIATNTDDGANFYINAGQGYLDRLMEAEKTLARHFRILDVGDYYITFKHCRAVKEVWAVPVVGDPTRERFKVEKMDPVDFRLTYVKSWLDLTQGAPLYYTTANLRMVGKDGEAKANISDFPADFLDVSAGDQDLFNGILLAPPPDEQYGIEVWGYFLSQELSSDADESFWTVRHPHILVMAACRQLEIVYRNTAGQNDWEAAIMQEIADIDKDTVEQVIADVSQMEG